MTSATSRSAATYDQLKERSNAFFRENPGAKVTRICVNNVNINHYSMADHLCCSACKSPQSYLEPFFSGANLWQPHLKLCKRRRPHCSAGRWRQACCARGGGCLDGEVDLLDETTGERGREEDLCRDDPVLFGRTSPVLPSSRFLHQC